MSSLAALKKKGSLENLTKALQATNNQKFKGDERFWTLSVDKAGNGHAIIRFLDTPECDGEDGLPYVQTWSHGFQGVGGWYIESSLTTIGKPDPVSEYNTKLWKTNIEANQNKARAQKRKLSIHQISKLSKTQQILKMMVRFSYSNMVRKYLINLKRNIIHLKKQ